MKTIREALRILSGREFWSDFRDYWSPTSIAERMDAWVERTRSDRDNESWRP